MPIWQVIRFLMTAGILLFGTVPSAFPQASESERIENLRRGTPNGAWRSTYEPLPSRPTVIRRAIVMTAAGEELVDTEVFFADGRIESVSSKSP